MTVEEKKEKRVKQRESGGAVIDRNDSGGEKKKEREGWEAVIDRNDSGGEKRKRGRETGGFLFVCLFGWLVS